MSQDELNPFLEDLRRGSLTLIKNDLYFQWESTIHELYAEISNIAQDQRPALLKCREIFEAHNVFSDLNKLNETDRSTIVGYFEKIFGWGFNDKRAFALQLERARKEALRLGGESGQKAAFKDYVDLFEKQFPGAKRDLLSGNIVYFNPIEEQWEPAINYVKHLKSIAHEEKFYQATKVEDHLMRWQGEKKAELVVSIEEWDGRDRISEIAFNYVVFKNCSCDAAYEAILDWGCRMIKRIYQPMQRTRILVFQGGQDKGKDWLIHALTAGIDLPGLGYVRNCQVDDSNEMELKLHRAVVWKLEELDRSRGSVAKLKHLVTAFNLDERLKFDKESKTRKARCSWIASANPDDLLRDSTGSTRFMILQIEKIHFDKKNPGVCEYPGSEHDPDRDANRRQIIAQYKHFADKNWKMSDENENHFREYNESIQPEDPTIDMLDYFDRKVSKLVAYGNLTDYKHKGWIPNKELDEVFEDMSKVFKTSRQEILRRIGVGQRRVHSGNKRGYRFNFIDPNKLPED